MRSASAAPPGSAHCSSALMNQIFGSLRPAILSLIFFFVFGLIVLPFVNVDKAVADVKKFEESRALGEASPSPSESSL